MRKERWEEEMELVTNEMDRTVNCFQYHERIWEERADRARGPGQMAYAWKQSSTWGSWAKTARDTFEALKNV